MHTRAIFTKITLTALLVGVVFSNTAFAQDFNPDADWKISAYLWAAGLDGTLGIDPIEADVDLSFSDLASALDIGGSLVARRDWGANLVYADLTYLSLSPDDQPTPVGSISAGLDLALLSAYYGRKWGSASKFGALLGGFRYMKMDLTMKASFNLPSEPVLRKDGSPSFTDFVIGGLYSTELGGKWDMLLQADVGMGGSNSSWMAQAMFQRKLKSGNRIDLGARVFSVDFDEVTGSGELFFLDANMYGLMAGFTWD